MNKTLAVELQIQDDKTMKTFVEPYLLPSIGTKSLNEIEITENLTDLIFEDKEKFGNQLIMAFNENPLNKLALLKLGINIKNDDLEHNKEVIDTINFKYKNEIEFITKKILFEIMKITFDDKGKMIYDNQNIAAGLSLLTNFIYNVDSRILLAFNKNKGIYVPAEVMFSEYISALYKFMNIKINKHSIDEMIMHISNKAKHINITDLNTKVISFGNGEGYDLIQNEYRKVKADDYSTISIGVVPDNDMETPNWRSALDAVFPNDLDTATSLEHAFAAALDYRSRKANQMFWLYGKSGNGKSTFLKVLAYILSFGNYTSQNISALSDSSFGLEPLINNSGDTVMAVIGEENSSILTNQAITILKSISEGNSINVNLKGKKRIELPTSNFAIYQSFNTLPDLNDEPALLRRVVLFPFLQDLTINPDYKIGEKLRDEAPGILAKLITQLPELQQNDYVVPNC